MTKAPRPEAGRGARGAFVILHEVAAGAVHGWSCPSVDRSLYRRHQRQRGTRGRGPGGAGVRRVRPPLMLLPRLFRLGNWVMRALPPGVRYPLAAVTGRCVFYVMPRRRRVAFENFGQVLGLPWNAPLVKRTARHAFGNYFKMFADFMLMDTLKPEQIRRMVRPQGVERIDRALAGGKGAIAVTAHVSNWDILAAASAGYGYPVSAVTNDLPSGGLNELVIASRERIGMKMIRLGPSSLRHILRALGRTELVALAGHLDCGDRGVRVPFFNRPAIFPAGPATIALKTGA